jgi:hypothetical protein
MLTAIREVQIPLLAAMLLGACLAKAWRALRPHAHPARSDPSDLFPAHLRRPIMVLVFAAELGLGLGLIGTAVKFGRDWPTLPATVVRTGTALFFLVAVSALNEMRQRRPDAGCGCFGELSGTPIGLRTIARPGLLCASAVATLGLPPLRMPSSSAEAELWLAVLAFELALIAFLSPELSEIMVRLGYSEPCELRRMPVGRTMGALHASSQCRRYAGPGLRRVTVGRLARGVLAVRRVPGIRARPAGRHRLRRLPAVTPAAVRLAVLDADTDEVLGPTGTRESAVL